MRTVETADADERLPPNASLSPETDLNSRGLQCFLPPATGWSSNVAAERSRERVRRAVTGTKGDLLQTELVGQQVFASQRQAPVRQVLHRRLPERAFKVAGERPAGHRAQFREF